MSGGSAGMRILAEAYGLARLHNLLAARGRGDRGLGSGGVWLRRGCTSLPLIHLGVLWPQVLLLVASSLPVSIPVTIPSPLSAFVAPVSPVAAIAPVVVALVATLVRLRLETWQVRVAQGG